MKGPILALQFLTIIPVDRKRGVDKNRLALSAAYFPLAGLLLGLILAVANKLLSLVPLEQFLINVILVILLLILTGGLHLDGLADTFDALLSRKNRFEMLNIMKDSHIGTMGVLSLISVILLKIAILASLGSTVKTVSLILMCLLSRYSLLLSIFLFRCAKEDGRAKIFIEAMNKKTFYTGTIISLLFALIFWQLKGLICFILVIFYVYLAGRFFTKRFGGITGDILGAINELAEIFVLFIILILNI